MVELGGQDIVVFYSIAIARDYGIFKPRDRGDHLLLHIIGQRGGEPIDIVFRGVRGLRL